MHILRRPTRILAAGLVLFLFALGLQLLLARHSPAWASVGPKRGIKCPPKAVKIGPGANIQRAINRRPRGTTFCLRPGVYKRRAPITPKSGNRFIGQFGAIIDGSRWRTNDPNQGLFRAHNQDIDNVVIRNLVIRSSPQRGIHAYKDHSDRWIIEHNRIQGNRVGISHGNHFQIRRNIIRRNWQYGITSFRSTGSVIAANRFLLNAARFRQFPQDSGTSKWAIVKNTAVRRNVLRGNHRHGIWFDTHHAGIIIENNVVARNEGNGIFHEAGGETIIRNNRVTHSLRGIYIADSHNSEVYGNVLSDNEHAIALFRDGNRHGSDLFDNLIRGNVVRVRREPIQPGQPTWAAIMWCSNMSNSECVSYSTNRNNRFEANAYVVPAAGRRYWFWGMISRGWGEWRATGQDATGSLRIG